MMVSRLRSRYRQHVNLIYIEWQRNRQKYRATAAAKRSLSISLTSDRLTGSPTQISAGRTMCLLTLCVLMTKSS